MKRFLTYLVLILLLVPYAILAVLLGAALCDSSTYYLPAAVPILFFCGSVGSVAYIGFIRNSALVQRIEEKLGTFILRYCTVLILSAVFPFLPLVFSFFSSSAAQWRVEWKLFCQDFLGFVPVLTLCLIAGHLVGGIFAASPFYKSR